MTTNIKDLRSYSTAEGGVAQGQVRANNCGRVVMVVLDKTMESDRKVSGRLKVLVLKEGECNGGAKPFETIPKAFTYRELAEEFPIILTSELTFK